MVSLIGYFPGLDKSSVIVKSFLFGDKVKRLYMEDIRGDYDSIKDHLPAEAKTVLDIGCGVAGIDVFISKHYDGRVDIFLIDRTTLERKVYYGFREKGAFYNSLALSKKFLEVNGVYPEKIHLQEANKDNSIHFDARFDIVLSLISWGFHYPVSTYLDEVFEKMNTGGILIIDVRKNTGGEGKLLEKFGNCKAIIETEKYVRVVSKKC
jgi:SAM-dependent methyltransferase